MKKAYIVAMVAGLMAWAGVSAMAGDGCCPSKKAKKDPAACIKAVDGIDLTAEQKAKIDEITAACKADSCSKEACAKSMKEIRDVLTDEQKASFDAACEKDGKGKSKGKDGGCG